MLAYTEKVCCPEGEARGPVGLVFLILLVRTMIDRMFPIRPNEETMVKSTPSIMRVERLSISTTTIL